MSLHYFLSCKRNYIKIIQKLEYIIETLDDINYATICEFSDICYPKNNKDFFTEKIKHFQDLIDNCNNELDHLCCHNFIDDVIDITPDRSQSITYCDICETVKT
jgi:hypothetical protein